MPKGIMYVALIMAIHNYFTYTIFPSALSYHTTNISVLSTERQLGTSHFVNRQH